VTPFELQLALQPSPTWTGEYVLDFDQVLARREEPPPQQHSHDEGDPDRPVFSLVTGKYRHAKRYGGEWLLLHEHWVRIGISQRQWTNRRLRRSHHHHHHHPLLFSETRTALYQHSGIALLVCSIDSFLRLGLIPSCEGEFLQSRTFRGLETRAGLDPPSLLQQGRSGIARGYGDDH
jgi:diphthamide biosynthesis protein 2